MWHLKKSDKNGFVSLQTFCVNVLITWNWKVLLTLYKPQISVIYTCKDKKGENGI